MIPFFDMGIVVAQEAGGGSSWIVKPTLSVEALYSDNIDPANQAVGASFVMSVSPGLRLSSTKGRLTGSLSTGVRELWYSNGDVDREQQTFLDATGRLEVVDKKLFLDASARRSLGSISAFGTQVDNGAILNRNNRATTTSWQFGPHLTGTVLGRIDYDMKLSTTNTKADSGVLSEGTGTSTTIATGRLGSRPGATSFGWNLTFQKQRADQPKLGARHGDRIAGAWTYDPSRQVRVTLGLESDRGDLVSDGKRSGSGPVIGLDWGPTERTKISLKSTRREFGSGHALELSHRTALSAWKFSDTKEVVLPADQVGQQGIAQLAQAEDDRRRSSLADDATRASSAASDLAAAGLTSDRQLLSGVLTSRALLQRRQLASVSLGGANNAVSFTIQQTKSDSSIHAPINDDLSTFGALKQSAMAAAWTHRISPDTTLAASVSSSEADASGHQANLRSVSFIGTKKLGPRTSASLSIRRTSWDNPVGMDYDENALAGSLQLSF